MGLGTQGRLLTSHSHYVHSVLTGKPPTSLTPDEEERVKDNLMQRWKRGHVFRYQEVHQEVDTIVAGRHQ